MRKIAQTGFSLVAAIFLIVIVAGLGTFMITIGTTQQQTSLLSVLQSRAVFAVDSGMQWGIGSVLAANVCFASPTTFNLTGGALAGYTVSLSCSAVNIDEGPSNYNVFQLASTASRGLFGSPDFVSRTLRASVTTAP
ncbi:MAG: hypothetical protein IIB73_08050 [Proteobacteria bacterium]|nr:hypothetical protein [Pseudomonadota bacterium]